MRSRLLFSLPNLLLLTPIVLLAQTPMLEMNVIYECRSPLGIKVLSCTGKNPTDSCAVQLVNAGHVLPPGKSTYAQVMQLLPTCHKRTAAEVAAEKSGAVSPVAGVPGGPPGAGPGGFKVGDKVRVLTVGWQEATILQIHGRSYYVRLSNGIEVSKDWPTEVRRLGTLTAADHAAGQYDAHDRVQVNINGRWAEGTIQGQQGNMYEIKVPGYRGDFDTDLYSTNPENIRMSTAPTPTPPPQRAAGQPPKPGYVGCAGKYEGRWESTSGMAGNQVIFRAGKVTVTEAFQKASDLDCFVGEGKIFLYKAGSFTPFNEPMEINNDGTLQTELGAIKKMGN